MPEADGRTDAPEGKTGPEDSRGAKPPAAPRITPTADLDDSTRDMLAGVARHLSVPVALLSRDPQGWRFEADAFPRVDSEPSGDSAPEIDPAGLASESAQQAWTGVPIGRARSREWLLIVPGSPDQWQGVHDLEGFVDRISRSLEANAPRDADDLSDLGRRLFAFVRRLARTGAGRPDHDFLLRTIASVVNAETAALALYDDEEQVLTITATLGYPLAIVEHLRIAPGHGVIGEVFSSRRATFGRPAPDQPRRYRYRTDSYLAVPIAAAGRTLAVITLTDRAGGGEFDDRDLAAARMFAAPAALALVRERIDEDVNELTRAATVDPVTGLFNRRHFESRVLAEVQRARRQQQDLALLMVDIDDFKRINDTFGHLEGDRALQEVAELLRSGVRIFDVCARYGGEEFAIVMPGASQQMAIQVAERIRRGIQDRATLDPIPITVSIGVGVLRPGDSAEDLVGWADRALILAKKAGKNMVKAVEPEE